MKKLVFVLSLLLMAVLSYAQVKNPVDIRESKLEGLRAKNGVKSMTITTYRVIKGVLSSESRQATVHFGTDGMKIEKNDGEDDKGFGDDRKPDPKLKTDYDVAKKVYSTRLLDESNQPKYEHIYKLDAKMKILELQVADYARGIRYTKKYAYDSRGNEIESKKYTTSGRLLQKVVKSYFKNNLVQGKMIYEPTDNIKQVTFYEYEFY